MPKYFFDVADGEGDFRDTGGIDMALKDIPAEARNLLYLLSYANIPQNEPSTLVASIRDEAGRVVYSAFTKLRSRTA